MYKIEVTKLEEKVIRAIANAMYGELGFSDVYASDIADEINISIKRVRGVVSSLIKKNLLHVDDNEMFKIENEYVLYLDDSLYGLVPHWREYDDNIKDVELIIK